MRYPSPCLFTQCRESPKVNTTDVFGNVLLKTGTAAGSAAAAVGEETRVSRQAAERPRGVSIARCEVHEHPPAGRDCVISAKALAVFREELITAVA